MTAFHDPSDTSSPIQLVSPYQSHPDKSDNFWQYNGDWYFDGFSTGNIAQRDYMDIKFYVRVSQRGGGEYWLGGAGSETQFNLLCHPCAGAVITGSNTHRKLYNLNSGGPSNQQTI